MKTSSYPVGRASHGFTLVELLVVFVIIATLGAITYSVSVSLIEKGRIVVSCENLRNLAISNMTYESENGSFCPADNQSNNQRWHGGRSSATGKFDPTKGFLSPYLGKSETVNVCPLFKHMVSGPGSFETGTGGYGYNAAYVGGRPGGGFDRNSKLRVAEKLINIRNPSRTVMFTTTAYARKSGLQEYPYCEPHFWDFGSGASGERPSPSVHFRANGKALVAWCDGHVTAESKGKFVHGYNPHGGDSIDLDLGWFGPEKANGYWNAGRR